MGGKPRFLKIVESRSVKDEDLTDSDTSETYDSDGDDDSLGFGGSVNKAAPPKKQDNKANKNNKNNKKSNNRKSTTKSTTKKKVKAMTQEDLIELVKASKLDPKSNPAAAKFSKLAKSGKVKVKVRVIKKKEPAKEIKLQQGAADFH